jgi:excisionase family DNA binding protein
MSNNTELLTVEEVANRLSVHVRTVRRYLREGRLKGFKMGKEYRIAANALSALTGLPEQGETTAVPRHRHSEASVVVHIDAIDREEAIRVMNGLGGAIKGRDKHSDTPLRLDTVYDETRARLKVIATGSLATTIGLMRLVETYATR